MKKTKGILASLLACATVLSFSACGGGGSVSSSAAVAPSSAEAASSSAAADSSKGGAASGQLIGVSMPTQSLQRWNQDGSNMKKQFESKGYKVELQYANNDVNAQVQQIENMVTKGCKILVIAAIDGSSLTDVLDTAKKNDCKVIAYDRLIMKTPNVDYYCSYDNYKVGTMQGQYLETKLGLKDGKGPFNIEIFGGDPGDNNAKYFYNGAMDVLNPYIKSGKLVVQSGQIDFAKVAITNWTSATAQNRMDNLITSKYTGSSKLDAVLSPNDSLAIGIVASLKSNGYGTSGKPYPILTGQDCDIPDVKAIKAGQQSMSIFKDTRLEAAKVISMVDAMEQGGTPETNNTKDYNNGSKIVPTELLNPVYVDKNNWDDVLVKSGYYTEDQLK